MMMGHIVLGRFKNRKALILNKIQKSLHITIYLNLLEKLLKKMQSKKLKFLMEYFVGNPYLYLINRIG